MVKFFVAVGIKASSLWGREESSQKEEDLQRLKISVILCEGIFLDSSLFVLCLWCGSTMGSSIKVDFEKFDEKGSFSMWKVRVEDRLVLYELDLTLEERPDGMPDQ